MAHRTEHDSLGDVEVPAEHYWGAQTQRSLQFFQIGEERIPEAVIAALVVVKRAAAQTNREIGALEESLCNHILAACDRIDEQGYRSEFPLSVWQTGSGTQTNMNVNEVIANIANERAGGELGAKSPVHPNDHVNRSQSSNDVFPTAMHIATAISYRDRLEGALDALIDSLDRKSDDYASVVKTGRTHMMDATPITLGQELSAFAEQLRIDRRFLAERQRALMPLALGGTAVGTGLNAPPEFAPQAVARIAEATDLPFEPATNHFALLAGQEPIAGFHAALKNVAVTASKLANDVRLLASGPRTGIGEVRIPANEPGSSIMPGKVNPTQCEALTQVAIQVMANDVAVGMASSQGQLQLNTYRPLIIHTVLQSIRLLADCLDSFRGNCLDGLEPDRKRIERYLADNLMLVTALAPHIGYDKASEIALHAFDKDLSLREAALELGHLSADDFDRWVDPAAMTGQPQH